MDSHFLFLFLCLLGRQQAGLKADRREAFFSHREARIFPPEHEFFRLFPEFEPWRDKPRSWWKKAAEELQRESERGWRFLNYEDTEFPQRLREIPDPPWVLNVLGSLSVLSDPGFSVVGAREPSAGSLQWMDEHLANVLKRLPLAVVSGGARGIDQAAHRLALRSERPTLLFLPSGLGQIYPVDLKDWILPVCDSGGAFVSEFHPRTPMRKWNFAIRNRLIAGIGILTLVIEARHRSGTWITAKCAIDSGRAIGCLPGSAWETSFSGNLRLLGEGAQLIKDADDLALFLCRELRTGTPSLALDQPNVSTH